MKTKTWIIPIIVVAIGVALLYAKFRPREGAATPGTDAAPALAIKWGGPKNISMLGLVAERENPFAAEGLEATYVDILTGKRSVDALRTKDIDLAVTVDTNIAFAGFSGAADVKTVGIIMKKTDDSLITANDTISSLADLAGQTVGVTLGTSSHSYLVHLLEARGIDPATINLQNMAPPAIQAGLLNGSLKAGCVWQPFRNSVLTEKQDAFKEWNDTSVYTCRVLLLARADFVETESTKAGASAVTAFLKGLRASEEFVDANKEASQQAMSEILSFPGEVVAKIWPEYEFAVSLEDSLGGFFAEEGGWISRTVPEYQGKKVPNYDGFIERRFFDQLGVNAAP